MKFSNNSNVPAYFHRHMISVLFLIKLTVNYNAKVFNITFAF